MIRSLFRLPSLPWRLEMGDLLRLAIPLAISQVGLILMNLTDQVMMGHWSADALAAGGLAGNVAFTMIIIPQGLLMALQPILAQLRGADNHGPFARTLAAAFTFGLLASLPIILLLCQIDRILIWTGTDPILAGMALDYEYGYVWGVPAALWQICCRYYLSAVERPRIILITILVACLSNLGLNWLLIFGHFGLPMLGLRGSAYATAICCWGMAISLTLYSARHHLFPPGLLQVRLAELKRGMAELMVTGWPIAGITIVEVALFTISTVLMSRFGSAALAAHQICLGIASVTFMVPMAIGQAGSVRVGFHIGAGQPARARQAGLMAMGLGVGFMCLAAAALKLFSDPVIRLYIDPADPMLATILPIGRQLISLAALFQIFDGAQAVAAGALRGLRDTSAALIAATFGYWVIGMPCGLILAFTLKWGPTGLWWGFVAGLFLVSISLTWRFNQLSRRLADGGPV
jgi:MATE family multidrug resistance protein